MDEEKFGGKTLMEILTMETVDRRNFKETLSKEELEALTKHLTKFDKGGFKRLMIEGFRKDTILSSLCAWIPSGYFFYYYFLPYINSNENWMSSYNILEIHFLIYWIIGGVLAYLIFYFGNGYYKKERFRTFSSPVLDEKWFKYIAMPILLLTFGWVSFTFFGLYFFVYIAIQQILILISKAYEAIFGGIES